MKKKMRERRMEEWAGFDKGPLYFYALSKMQYVVAKLTSFSTQRSTEVRLSGEKLLYTE